MPCGTINETVRGCRDCYRLIPDCGGGEAGSGTGTEGCCHCLPAYLCVSFKITDPSTGACGECDCDRYDTRLALSCPGGVPAYSGTIVCGSMTIDVAFSILRDDSGQCILCLTSEELGLACTSASGYTGADAMAAIEHNYDCGVPIEPSASPTCCCLNCRWEDIDLSGVTGAGTECLLASLTTRAAAYSSPNWSDCSPCWESCGCISCSVLVCLLRYDDTAVIRCQECRDCEEMVFDPSIGSYGGWGPVTLTCGDISTEVELHLNAECGMSISASGFTVDDQLMGCPDFGLSITLDDDPSDTVELHITSNQCGAAPDAIDPPAECEGCCSAMADIHCEDPEFTITISSNDCAALNASATLTQLGPGECVVYDSTANADFCDPETDPACDACALAGWSAELDCDPDCNSSEPCKGAFLSFSWDNACCDELSGSTLGTLWPTECTCEPFSLTFEIPAFTNACCSCDSNTCSDVVITISEA